MSDGEQAFIVNDKGVCSTCYDGWQRKMAVSRRSTKSKSKAWLWVGIAAAVLILLLLKQSGTRQAPTHRPHDMEAFDPESLVGVECLFTDQFHEPLTVLGDNKTVVLERMQRVTVQKVIHEPYPDDSHPRSLGYKFYITTRDDPKTTLVMYPNGVMINKYNGKTSWNDLQLCRVSDYVSAVSAWKDKSFKFQGTKVGEIEVQSGTVIKVTAVEPVNYEDFRITVILPSGASTTHWIGLDGWQSSMEPIGP
jgi:hypothetical protein